MKKYVIAALTALALMVAGLAYASIPDSGGLINSCYRTTDGDLRVSDAACRTDETALVLNGIGGYEYLSSSVTFNAGTSDNRGIACSSGKKVLGGGWEYVSGAGVNDINVISSGPYSTDHEWQVRIQVNGSTNLSATVYTICAKVS